jgi:hypothetical protein
VITFRKLALATALCAIGATGASTAFAQSTDGFHTFQVFPVVVDTASFTQRFTFRNPNANILSMNVRYFPADGTTGPILNCGTKLIAADSDITYTSLRSLCPNLNPGSQFGFLYTYEVNTANNPYSGFSRIANPQGNGFSVEAFPAHTFTSAFSSVTGVRRLAATGGSPAFHTNCFLANLNELTAPTTAITDAEIDVRVYNSADVQIGSTLRINVLPGRMVRLFDVFDAVGAPLGDYNDARVEFSEQGETEPGHMALCTVQDNTSLGADFRIAKQEVVQDNHVVRDNTATSDIPLSASTTTASARAFQIAAGGSHNDHVYYFRHPDHVACTLINPATGLEALDSHGLEMRLMGPNGIEVIAGGSNETGFGDVYLGDKYERNNGANTRYIIAVENNGQNFAAVRSYRIHCTSGSGHTQGEIVRYQEPVDHF